MISRYFAYYFGNNRMCTKICEVPKPNSSNQHGDNLHIDTHGEELFSVRIGAENRQQDICVNR